jgi:hypothetical protein
MAILLDAMMELEDLALDLQKHSTSEDSILLVHDARQRSVLIFKG